MEKKILIKASRNGDNFHVYHFRLLCIWNTRLINHVSCVTTFKHMYAVVEINTRSDEMIINTAITRRFVTISDLAAFPKTCGKLISSSIPKFTRHHGHRHFFHLFCVLEVHRDAHDTVASDRESTFPIILSSVPYQSRTLLVFR